MSFTFSHHQYLSPDIISLYFKPVSAFNYLPGQYVEVKFPDEHISSIGDNRWYTLSSSPSEDLLAITAKLIKPYSEFKNRIIKLKPGEEVILSQPIGDFVLPMDKKIPLVFISGGIGITPVRSIIKWLIDNNEQRQISLMNIVKKKQDMVFDGLFRDYKMSYISIVTENKEGVVPDTDNLIKISSPSSIFYISGPQTMVEYIAGNITNKYSSSQVIMDYFPGYSSI